MVIPHAESAYTSHILAKRALDDRIGERGNAGARGYPWKSPRGGAVPQVFDRRVVVDCDAVVPILAAEFSLIGIAQVRVVHAEFVIGMGVRDLCKSTEVRRVSARQED